MSVCYIMRESWGLLLMQAYMFQDAMRSTEQSKSKGYFHFSSFWLLVFSSPYLLSPLRVPFWRISQPLHCIRRREEQEERRLTGGAKVWVRMHRCVLCTRLYSSCDVKKRLDIFSHFVCSLFSHLRWQRLKAQQEEARKVIDDVQTEKWEERREDKLYF